MSSAYLKDFLECHSGKINGVLHVIGLALQGVAIFEKSIPLFVLGGVSQELGHVYQYVKTGKTEHSPWFCARSQHFLAHILFVLVVLYMFVTA